MNRVGDIGPFAALLLAARLAASAAGWALVGAACWLLYTAAGALAAAGDWVLERGARDFWRGR